MGTAAIEVTLAHRTALDFAGAAEGASLSPDARAVAELAQALNAAGLGAIEIVPECPLPSSSARVDVVLVGTHVESGVDSYVLVEFKQWRPETRARSDAPWPGLMEVDQYLNYLDRSFGPESETVLIGAVLVSGAPDEAVVEMRRQATEYSRQIHVASNADDLIGSLKPLLSSAGAARSADRYFANQAKPRSPLMSLAAAEVRNKGNLVLLGSQLTVLNVVTTAVMNHANPEKRVFIVTGAPGTGKTVVALKLLGELDQFGYVLSYASGSRTLTQALRKTAGSRNRRLQTLFKYFNNFTDVEENDFDLLVCDDAQQIRATSASRYTPAARRTGQPQINELIKAARVTVFLLDETQPGRPGEVGSVALIQAAAAAQGLSVDRIDLHTTFRAGGSEAYLAWVDRLLIDEPAHPTRWQGDARFDLEVAESPAAMESSLKDRVNAGTARMMAGFCWPWSDPNTDTLPNDLTIGEWQRPWAGKGDRQVGAAPPAVYWATEDSGFDQVGNIYTAQGLEFNWAGVIIGPDLIWRDGGWVTNREASQDPTLARRASDAEFSKAVRNSYRILLTRGLSGTLVYSVDPETQEFLRSLIDQRA